MFAIAQNQNDCSSNLVKSQGFCCCCLAVKGNKFQKNQFIGSLLYTCDMQEKRSVMWQSQQWTPTVWAWSHWISLTLAYTRCALEYGLYLPDQIICLELSMCWQKKRGVDEQSGWRSSFFSIFTVASGIFHKGVHPFISRIRLFLWLLGCQRGLLGSQLVWGLLGLWPPRQHEGW